MKPSKLIKEECIGGDEVLVELPDISLASLNNLMAEHPLLLGLKIHKGKTMGIVGYVGV